MTDAFALVGAVADRVAVLCRLPVRTVALALAQELEIAVEALEPCSSQ